MERPRVKKLSKHDKPIDPGEMIHGSVKVRDGKPFVSETDGDDEREISEEEKETRVERGGAIETEVVLNPEHDSEYDEMSSDEEDRTHFRKEGRRVIERQFADERVEGELSEDELMQQIDKNPRLWNLVNQMISKASSDRSKPKDGQKDEAAGRMKKRKQIEPNQSTPAKEGNLPVFFD